MYYIHQSDPKIILIGINENQIYGFGEKDGKLCIYTKAIFDIGEWKEFYKIDINVVKCDQCDTGIHVAGGVACVDEIHNVGVFNKQKAIWIAAREEQFNRIFSINIDTKEFTRYKMLQEELVNTVVGPLNLCCKCLTPVFRYCGEDSDSVSYDITPQKYQNDIGIFRILISIYPTNKECVISKASFDFDQHPVSPNILINDEGEILTIFEKSESDGRIEKFGITTDEVDNEIYFLDENDDDYLCHEIAFSSPDGLCLIRRNEGDKSILRLNNIRFPNINSELTFSLADYCTVDTNFPSVDSTHFFVTWRIVDEECESRAESKMFFYVSQLFAVPSMIVFQTADGNSIVTIPLRILSLSEAAYLSLAQIRQPFFRRHKSLPVATISVYHQFFHQLREFCGKEDAQSDPWMSKDFIKTAIGWPRILPLIKAPNLSMN